MNFHMKKSRKESKRLVNKTLNYRTGKLGLIVYYRYSNPDEYAIESEELFISDVCNCYSNLNYYCLEVTRKLI